MSVRLWRARGSRDRSWSWSAARVGVLYAVRGAGAPVRGGHGWGGDSAQASVMQDVDGAHVAVETSSPGADDWLAENAEALLFEWQGRQSYEAVTWPVQQQADRWHTDVRVGSAVHRFLVVGEPMSWVARGTVDGRIVGLSVDGLSSDGIVLVPLTPSEVGERDWTAPEVPDGHGYG